MSGIAGARDDQQVGAFGPRAGDELVGRGRIVERHHQGARSVEVQAPQQLDLRHVAVIHRRAAPPLARHAIGIAVDRDIRHLVHIEHRRYRLADPAEPCEDHPRGRVGKLRHQDPRVDRRRGGEVRREPLTQP